ncbi:hypothetical protein VIGAN_10043400 [Vigna angularis var. angularis]|uniref:Uncharacterized protein n=1 Tax=Vigna angularis var. angularis TaxID=157739 RepID=A0A0S3T234_PHAAN|nr:hypothetical protein VIGAN_10043400 [Vigna angularis var. angularis]
MGRPPCCEKTGLKKGPWTPEEDQKLIAFIENHGHGSWRALPAKAGLLCFGSDYNQSSSCTSEQLAGIAVPSGQVEQVGAQGEENVNELLLQLPQSPQLPQ